MHPRPRSESLDLSGSMRETAGSMRNSGDSRLQGIIATPVTPLAADGTVDYATHEQLIRFLVEHRADGIALPTHMGESLSLSLEERSRLVRRTVELVDQSIPVVVHVSATDPRDVLWLASDAERIGASGLLVHPPYHSRLTPAALAHYFAWILSRVTIPVYGYNSRTNSGFTLPGDLVVSLAREWTGFRGIKDISGSVEYLSQVCEFAVTDHRGFSVLVGGENLIAGMALGVTGSFAGAFAIAPRMVRALYDACLQHNLTVARPLQFRIATLLRALSVHYPSRYKIALEIMGRPTGRLRLEVGGEYESERSIVEEILGATGVMDAEPAGWTSTD